MPFTPDWLFGSDTLFAVLCTAFLLDAVAGGLPGFRWILNLPALFAAAVAIGADRRLNRPKRSPRSRRFRGALVFFVLLPVAVYGGLHAAALCRSVPDGWAIETVLVAMCVGLQRPLMTAGAVRRAIARAGLERARTVLGRAVRYETDAADEHALVRGSVELFAARLCDGFVGPVFWYLLAGLPGLFVYRVVVSAADVLVYRTEHHAAFGTAAAKSSVPAPSA